MKLYLWEIPDNHKTHNTLTIGLKDITPETLQALSNFLEEHEIPKDAILVRKFKLHPLSSVSNIPTDRDDYYPIFIGGIKIKFFSDYTYKETSCTFGFTAKINGVDYIITAGHCGYPGLDNDSYWGMYYQPEIEQQYEIGSSTYTQAGPRYSDTVIIKANRPIDPRIYGNYQVVGKRSWEYQYIGTTVCKSGIRTGETCGTIIGKPEIVEDSTGFYLYLFNQVEATFIASESDSGAPVYYRIYPTYNVVIYGTIVGEGEGGEVIYSPIDGIEQDFGITLQVTWS